MRDKDVLRRISDQAKAYILNSSGADLLSHNLHGLADPGHDIFYHAPVLVVISSITESRWAVENCALAAENLMLAACAAGLGSCFIGLAQAWLATPEGKTLIEVPVSYQPVAPIILGHPKFLPPPVARRQPELRWIG